MNAINEVGGGTLSISHLFFTSTKQTKGNERRS